MPDNPMPLIGVTACRVRTESHANQRVTEKYVTVLVEEDIGCPVMIPALETGMHPEVLVRRLDGILLTGSPSNVEPHHYDGGPSESPDEHDPARDAVTLPLIRAAVAAGVPILGLCRGIQEMNVAFGGSLVQRIQEDTARLDHRMRRDVPFDWKYRKAHPVTLTPGGLLERIAGPGPHMVNSLHGQGIDRPGARVRVEATAPDGVIEAISIAEAPGFALGVQWHPEWPRPCAGIDKAVFQAFGDAVRARLAGLAAAAE
jgi:putative glutamine amidotransferase